MSIQDLDFAAVAVVGTEEKPFTREESFQAVRIMLEALMKEKAEVEKLKAALEQIANLDRHVDGMGEINEYAEAVCFNKARRIAHGELNLHKLRAA